MQLAGTQFEEAKVLCNQILECIQQPISFRDFPEYLSVNAMNITSREDISTATLHSLSHAISQQITNRVQSSLSPSVMDPILRSIYSKERHRCSLQLQHTIPDEEVTTVHRNECI